MLKKLSRLVSDALFWLGAERLSLWFLIKSLEVVDVDLDEVSVVSIEPFDGPKVIYEDKEQIAALGDKMYTTLNPKNMFDDN